MAKTPFKMRSGNSPLFKQMGGSPVKKTYKEAYAGLSDEKKATQSEAEFTKAAKAWNVKKYGTTEPTKESKKLIGQYEGDMTTAPKVTKKTAKQELESRHQTQTIEDIKLRGAETRIKEGIRKGELKKKEGGGVVDIKKHTVKSKREISVKEARGRGKERVKATRKTFGRGSEEVKAAKKLKKDSIKLAKTKRRARRKKKREERKV